MTKSPSAVRAPRVVFTRPEVADRLTLSVNGVDQIIREGKLRAVRIGRRVIVRAEDLEEFLAGLPEV